MYEHRTEKISPHITQITDPSGVFLFLVEGEKEALLVDTGTGFVGLRETVDALTSKPLKVLLTHMHPDHAGGAATFPQVYVHPADIPAFREQTLESRMGYAASQMPGLPLTESDFLPPVEEESHFLPLEDGTVFHLGGISITLSGLAIAALVGIVMNAVLPGKDYEFGTNEQGDTSVNFGTRAK